MNRVTYLVGGGIVVFLLLITTLFGTWGTVDETERGVKIRNGAVLGEIIQPGLFYNVPFIEHTDKISIAMQTAAFRDNPLETYSFDQQLADFKVSVNYHVAADKVLDVRRQYYDLGGVNSRLIVTYVPKVLKDVFGTYTAQRAIQERTKLNADFQAALQDAFAGTPVTLDSVQIEDIKFSDVYQQSVEAKQLAEVEVQRLQNQQKQADVQANITVINAKASADALVAQATAEATQIKLRGDAEAGVIKARADALASNPNVVGLIAAEKWDGKLPSSMPPGSAVPFINLPSTVSNNAAQ